MSEEKKLHSILDLAVTKKKKGQKSISYSQYSMYAQCPHRWKLNYVDNLRTFTQSIHTLFGTAFHETLQGYLGVMYEGSIKEADELPLGDILKGAMAKEYRKAMAMGQEPGFTNKTEMREFFYDGIAILEYFIKKRGGYFSKKNTKLVGVETPLSIPLEVNKNILFTGYIDIVMQDTVTGKYKIYDIKTSTRGWNKYQKADKIKTSQMVLYKTYFAEQFNVDPEMIDIEYFIVRRKIDENAQWPMKRIQTFVPASGKPTRNKIARSVDEFINNSFTSTGEYNTSAKHLAIAGKNNKNCKYCEFKDREDLCSKMARIKN